MLIFHARFYGVHLFYNKKNGQWNYFLNQVEKKNTRNTWINFDAWLLATLIGDQETLHYLIQKPNNQLARRIQSKSIWVLRTSGAKPPTK